MAARKRKFDRGMSTDGLLEWLAVRGVGELDRKRIGENGFTGESFLLLDNETMKEMGVKVGGQMVIRQLLAEAKATSESCENTATIQNPTSLPSGPPANDPRVPSMTVTNDLSNDLDVSSNTRNPIRQNSSNTHSAVIQNQLSVNVPSNSGGQDNITPNTETHNTLTSSVPSNSSAQNDVQRVEPTSQGASSDSSREEEMEVQRVEPTSQGASSYSSREEEMESSTEDNFREEEAAPYCTTGPYEGSSVFSYDHSIYMYRDKVWAGRQVLRVYFLNPETLRKWGLTTEVILDWAAAWQRNDDERIPIFQKCFAAKKADIRVTFSGYEGCWSAVGMDAEKIVTQRNPTMMLNLNGLSPQFQRSLVIHEFGHALGLDHEHQRSDFWEVVGKYFDSTKIPQSQRIRVKKTDDMMDREEASSRYDPQSIMHYWFDIQWLQPACRDINNVMRLAGLTRQERSYLIGLHQRQGEDLLPLEPSRSDLEHLSKAYESSGPREVPNVHSGSHRLPYSQSVDVPPTHPRLGTQPVSRLVSSPAGLDDDHVVLSAEVHLRAIKNAVWDARAKWKEIGRELRFSRYDLDTMTGDAGANLETVLVMWMRRGGATIDQLLDVLRSSLVRRHDLADKIERTRDSKQRQELGLQGSDR